MIRLILTRHGETVWNIEGRVQGALDSPLTERGILQAQCLAKRLKHEQITHLYSSDLPRAIATAEQIRQELQLSKIIISPAIRELSFGEWEGKAWYDLRNRYPDSFSLWDRAPHEVQIPGGESMWEVTERAWQFICDLPRLHQNETVCVVTHGMTLQLLVKKALGLPVETWEGVPWQHNTAVNIFELSESGTIKPLLLADHTHLEMEELKPSSGIKRK